MWKSTTDRMNDYDVVVMGVLEPILVLLFWCRYPGKGMGQCRVRNITIVKLICAFAWHDPPLDTKSVIAYSISRTDIGPARSEWKRLGIPKTCPGAPFLL